LDKFILIVFEWGDLLYQTQFIPFGGKPLASHFLTHFPITLGA